jgi:hypothetical protein
MVRILMAMLDFLLVTESALSAVSPHPDSCDACSDRTGKYDTQKEKLRKKCSYESVFMHGDPG